MKKNVCIYRTVYPFVSESFITEQVKALTNYNAIIVCRDKNEGVLTDKSVFDVKSKREKRNFTFLRNSYQIELFLINNKIDIIHAHFLPDAVMIAPIAKKLAIPLLATSHGFDTQMSRWSQFKTCKPTNWQFLLHEKSLYKDASAFIAVSSYMRTKMLARGIPDNKIITHYIGVDTDKFVPLNEHGHFILNVSRHVQVKGIDVLLKAFAKVPESLGWTLIQVGAGPETLALKALAKDLGIDARVEWRGSLPHADVRPLMQQCACYVQASLPVENGQTEAFGIVLLEAAASGVPVIASRSGGMPEAMLENETGYLFEAGNDTELAERLNLVLEQTDEWRKKMGQAGRQFAMNLNIRKQSLLLEDIYDQIVDGGISSLNLE